MPTRSVRIAAAACVAAILLSGCGHNGGSQSSTAELPQDAAASGKAAAGSSSSAGSAIDARPASTAGPVAANALQSRTVVRTATLGVQVPDVDQAANALTVTAAALGGRIDGDSRNAGDSKTAGDARTAELLIRVPPQRLDQAIAAADRLGRETARSVRGEDVTASVADVNARVAALQVSVRRLQALMSTSASLAELISLESQLTQRQSELDSISAQQRALSDQVALASLTVTFANSGSAAPAAKPFRLAGFSDSLATGWHALSTTVRAVLAAAGYVLPFAGAAMVLALAGLGISRRRRSRAQPQP